MEFCGRLYFSFHYIVVERFVERSFRVGFKRRCVWMT